MRLTKCEYIYGLLIKLVGRDIARLIMDMNYITFVERHWLNTQELNKEFRFKIWDYFGNFIMRTQLSMYWENTIIRLPADIDVGRCRLTGTIQTDKLPDLGDQSAVHRYLKDRRSNCPWFYRIDITDESLVGTISQHDFMIENKPLLKEKDVLPKNLSSQQKLEKKYKYKR